MKIDSFEDILSWQKSRELAIRIYQLFAENRDYGSGTRFKGLQSR